MVGAVLVRGGRTIGEGWHRKAGEPHAEIEAIRDAQQRGRRIAGSTLYVTLEPCCTQGRTPPCTEAILRSGIARVVVAAVDPNPRHAGEGIRILRKGGIRVEQGSLEDEATEINEAFNHWIVRRTPFVTVKAAMTLDGKIATPAGESKWITGEAARRHGMRLRERADAILAGVNTIIADDPSLTFRAARGIGKTLRRIILDANARMPLSARAVTDEAAHATTIVVSTAAPKSRVGALGRRVNVWTAPARNGRIDLRWLLRKLGREEVTDLLVEGGGEVNASFLLGGHAQRVAFFYAPKILGGRDAIKGVAGAGLLKKQDWLKLREVQWKSFGKDLFMTARIA
jgi:diaminohydroxyphosphoribosylaminopyrimidine deaminase / 5-amino-6-(5-phosphoribosylamino)uracil reductase